MTALKKINMHIKQLVKLVIREAGSRLTKNVKDSASVYFIEVVFFFSSRRRHTRCGRDWSSDVCSSDLEGRREDIEQRVGERAQCERVTDEAAQLARVARGRRVDDRVAQLRRSVRDDSALAEQRGRFADPVALADARLQPLDAPDIELAVATLAAGGALGMQHAVPLLPLATRVGRDAG